MSLIKCFWFLNMRQKMPISENEEKLKHCEWFENWKTSPVPEFSVPTSPGSLTNTMNEPDLDVVDRVRKQLMGEIDCIVQKLGGEHYKSEFLQKQNVELEDQLKHLHEDKQLMHDELNRKNEQIMGFAKIMESANKTRLQHGEEIKTTFTCHAKVVGMQYEVK